MAKVKITGHASGSGVITVTAPNTSTDRTITLPDATATIATTTDVAAKAPIASPEFTGNVGVQVTPENWNGARPGLQIGSTGSISGKNDVTDNHMNVTANAFLNRTSLSTGWDYMYTNKATNYYQQDGKHVFRTTPSGTADTAITWTTAMTIDNNGIVFKGSPSAGSGNTTEGWYLDSSASLIGASRNGGASAIFNRNSNNGEVVRLHREGSLVGNISVTTSSTAYNTSSDYRLKENVDYDGDATTRLKQLKPARFNFIVDDTTTVDGFIAHEVSSVVPEAISGTKDAMQDEEYEVTPAVMDGDTVVTEAVMGTRSVPDMQGIDQSKLVPLLVKTIQELEARITALEA